METGQNIQVVLAERFLEFGSDIGCYTVVECIGDSFGSRALCISGIILDTLGVFILSSKYIL